MRLGKKKGFRFEDAMLKDGWKIAKSNRQITGQFTSADLSNNEEEFLWLNSPGCRGSIVECAG